MFTISDVDDDDDGVGVDDEEDNDDDDDFDDHHDDDDDDDADIDDPPEGCESADWSSTYGVTASGTGEVKICRRIPSMSSLLPKSPICAVKITFVFVIFTFISIT